MPKLLKTPFAVDAAEGFRTDIQESTGAAPNSATYQVGFPPVTMQSIASNGMPPKGSDLNGVLYDITDNLVFLTQGGGYGFDSAYATSIGGYPINARLRLTNGDIVKSTIDGNTNDPNTDMTGWTLDDGSKALTKLNSQFLSVWDFFTLSESIQQINNPSTFDANRPLQAFFDAISPKDYGTAYCSGDFNSSQPIVWGGVSGSLTKHIVGDFSIKALNAIDILFQVSTRSDVVWNGHASFIGTGSTSYASRTCRTGVQMGTLTESASRCKFEKLTVNNFYEHGVYAPNVTSLSDIGFVRANNCGSGYLNNLSYSLLASSSSVSNTGLAGSTSQRSVITVDTLPPENLEYSKSPVLAIINDQPYYIYSVDRTAKTLTVFPWVDSAFTSGQVVYQFGGAVCIAGGDSSVLRGTCIDAIGCGRVLMMSALYQPLIRNITMQYCGAGVVVGANPSAATIGGQITGYWENTSYDFIFVSRAEKNMFVPTQYALNFNKIRFCGAARDASNNFITYDNLKGVIVNDGNVIQYQRNKSSENPSSNIDVTDKNNADIIYYGNNSTLTLATPNMAMHNLFGIFKRRVIVYGTGRNGRPTTVNFALADAANYTINGSAQTTESYTGFIGMAVFEITYRDPEKRFYITPINSGITATTTYDPPSLTTGSRSPIQSLTVQGAVLGDNVSMSFSLSLQGVSLEGYVHAANTVNYYFENRTGATVDLGLGTVRAKII